MDRLPDFDGQRGLALPGPDPPRPSESPLGAPVGDPAREEPGRAGPAPARPHPDAKEAERSPRLSRRQWLALVAAAAFGGFRARPAGAAATDFVDTASNQTITGVKTFTRAPVVPEAAFPESAVGGLVADLAGKQAKIAPGTFADFSSGPLARRPAAGDVPAKYLYLATDVNRGTLYQSDANTWTQASAGVKSTYANVIDHGAKGDGVTDDTAAIQAAIDASLGVFFPAPAAAYKCLSPLTLRTGSHLVGEATGGDSAVPLVQLDSWVVGFSARPWAIRVPAGAVGAGSGVILENLWVRGHAVETTDWSASGYPSYGFYGGTQTSDLLLANCTISGFNYNVWLMDAVRCRIQNTLMKESLDGNVVLYGLCQETQIVSSELRVVNESARASSAVSLQNVWLLDRDNGRLFPSHISMRDCLVDEVARSGQTAVPATIRLGKCSDVVLDNIVVYTPINGNNFRPNGGGYGVTIGPDCRRVSLRNVRIEPYARDANHVPLQTILVDAAAAGCSLENVSTVTNGGGDLLDRAPDTQWTNVNGITKPASWVEMRQVTNPDPPSAGGGRLYLRDRGSGKSEVVVRFPSGAMQVIAAEP